MRYTLRLQNPSQYLDQRPIYPYLWRTTKARPFGTPSGVPGAQHFLRVRSAGVGFGLVRRFVRAVARFTL